MKTLPPTLAAHLASRVTTLAACWRVERADGVVLGFTDHDRKIAFNGDDYEPTSGLDASEAVAHAGLQVGGLEVAGALSSERITEEDLAAGLYDNARVETWLVNWQTPTQRHLMRVASIGEVRRDDGSFTAELRSLSHALGQERGRIFRATCDADLGDERCKIDLSSFAFASIGEVSATDGHGRLDTSFLADRPTGFFDQGLLTFTSGENAGRQVEVLRHVRDDAGDHIELWQKMVAPIAPGDTLMATAGCDKRFATCRDRFDNVANFRGVPHMPGNDFALSYPTSAGGHQGEALVE